jgi:hypothetical protein
VASCLWWKGLEPAWTERVGKKEVRRCSTS